MAEIISNTWFNNSRGTIGVVLAKNDYGQKGFISQVSGDDEDKDAKSVLDWGSSLSLRQALGFFGDLVDEEKYGDF